MKWLEQIRNWSEVRRFMLTIVPAAGMIWVVADRRYQSKLDHNIRDVGIENAILDLSQKVDGQNHQIAEIRRGQDSLCVKLDEFEKQEAAKIERLESQIQKNHEAFMFSIEHQGDVTREVMIDMVKELSRVERIATPPLRYYQGDIVFEPIED